MVGRRLTDSLHEIIFENRNQKYGAYVIRNAYPNTVTKSLAITFSFVTTVILSIVVYNNLTSAPIDKPIIFGGDQVTPYQFYEIPN